MAHLELVGEMTPEHEKSVPGHRRIVKEQFVTYRRVKSEVTRNRNLVEEISE